MLKRFLSALLVAALLCTTGLTAFAAISNADYESWRSAAAANPADFSGPLSEAQTIAAEVEAHPFMAQESFSDEVAAIRALLPAAGFSAGSGEALIELARCYHALARYYTVVADSDAYANALVSAAWFYAAYANENGTPALTGNTDLALIDDYIDYCASHDKTSDLEDFFSTLYAADKTGEFRVWYDQVFGGENASVSTDTAPVDSTDAGHWPTGTVQLGYWSINESADPWHGLYFTDEELALLDLGELTELLGGTLDITDDRAAVLHIYDETMALTNGASDLEIDGQAFSLDYPVRFEHETIYAELSDVCWMLYLTATEGDSLERDYYNFTDSDGAIFFLAPDCGDISCSTEQAAWLQGVSAPINTHNYLGALGAFSGEDYAGAVVNAYAYVNGYTGVPHYGWTTDIQDLLASSWSITDRSDLLDSIDWLATEGHRTDFAAAAAAGELPDWFTAKWGTQFDDTALIGWDFGRIVQLAQWGYCAGYLEPGTALALCVNAATVLQSTYTGWQGYGEDCRMGYDLFLGENADSADNFSALRGQIIADLYQNDLYADTVGWDVPLPVLPEDAPSDSDISSPNLDAAVSEDDVWTGITVYFLLRNLCNVIGAVIGLCVIICRNRRTRRARNWQNVDPWAF